uniref:Uncharacterized protein n=1 Tax=Chrysemys picta bellii TaxID=8478 RepID=A0A8C3H5G6_CHRPI
MDDVFWGYNKCHILDRLRLDGKVAYVTGGGQGIGRAFAHALGEAGAKVAVVDLVLAKAEVVAEELSLKVHPSPLLHRILQYHQSCSFIQESGILPSGSVF